MGLCSLCVCRVFPPTALGLVRRSHRGTGGKLRLVFVCSSAKSIIHSSSHIHLGHGLRGVGRLILAAIPIRDDLMIHNHLPNQFLYTTLSASSLNCSAVQLNGEGKVQLLSSGVERTIVHDFMSVGRRIHFSGVVPIPYSRVSACIPIACFHAIHVFSNYLSGLTLHGWLFEKV